MNKTHLTPEYIENLSHKVDEFSQVDSSLYTKYDVKRGLRNANGTGVLVGLTTVGNVSSYIIENDEKVAIPGKLSYRGIEIRDIIAGLKGKRMGFEEVIFLLLFSKLPNKEEFETFCDTIASYRELPYGFTEDMILKAPSKDIMNKLARGVLSLYSYDNTPDDTSIPNVIRQVIELISRLSVIAAYGYQAKKHYFDGKSLVLHRSKEEYSIAENFLHLIRTNRKFSPLEAEILDLMLILHAEHGGGNNSTFTTHVVTSSGTDVYSAIAAAIGSLKGPRHGGANIKVVEMMEDLCAHVKDWDNDDEIMDYLAKILDKKAYDKSGLIYGMGHAVYTISDPRAELLREKARELAEEKGAMQQFRVYEAVERLAPVVINRKTNKIICANVDLYSGFVYQMLNIPKELFTPLFAISRIAGWGAHILEEISMNKKIMRPAYKCVSKDTVYTPMEERE
ncbi:MAG: citrate/2-methylcitrate synthase [Clostridia bacterium]|nr:citrate/2-methylcitrate synthase [Clostridia bacterium]